MAGRTQIDSGIGRARINPVAAPVDTFVREGGGSGLSQLAEALKTVAPAVGQFSDVQAERSAKRDKEAGSQKAREMLESGVTYKEAIRKGLIPAHASPWFQVGAREQFGRVSAGRFSTDLQNAVEMNGDLQASTDVKDFDKFLGDFRKQWMSANVGEEKDRTLDFERGFGPTSDAYTEDARRQFIAQAGNRLVKQVGDNHYQEVFQTLDHELSVGTNPDAIADALNIINDRAIAHGMNATVANVATVNALGDIIVRDGNLELFNVLKKVRGGSGMLYSRAQTQDIIQKVTDVVSVKKQRQANAAAQARAEQLEEATKAAESAILDKLLDAPDPSAIDLTKDLHELAKINPTAARQYVTFQETMTTAKYQSNQQVVNETLANIYNPRGEPVTQRSLVRLLNAGEINQQDFITLRSQVQQRDDHARELSDRANRLAHEKNPFTDPQFRDAQSRLRSQYVAEYDYDATRNARANAAQADFIQRYLQWENSEGKNVSPLDKAKFLTFLGETITAKYPTTQEVAPPKPDPDHPTVEQPWRLRKYARPQTLDNWEREWNSKDGPSPYTIQLFQRFKIKPNEVREFIDAQRALYTTK